MLCDVDDFLDEPNGDFEWGPDTRRRGLASTLRRLHRKPAVYLVLIGIGAALLAIGTAVAWTT